MAATLSETRTLPSPRPLTLQRLCERVRWCGLYLSAGTVGQLLLDVHGQHLTAEGQALGLLYDLLVGRHRVVAHHHVALEGGGERRRGADGGQDGEKYSCTDISVRGVALLGSHDWFLITGIYKINNIYIIKS